MNTIELDTNHQLISGSYNKLNNFDRFRVHSYGQLSNAILGHDQLSNDAERDSYARAQKDMIYDPSQNWIYIGAYDNRATSIHGNENAGIHYLHASIRNDGKIELAWFNDLYPFESYDQHIVTKYNETSNDANHNPIRIASRQEVENYMLTPEGNMKVYTFPKCIYYYSWLGFYYDTISHQIGKVFGCPMDLWMATHDNVIYLYLHTPSNMQTFKSLTQIPSEISNYYVIDGRGSMYILQPDLPSLARHGYLSQESVVHDRVIAAMTYTYYVDGIKFLEVGDAYKSMQVISPYGIYPSDTVPYYKYNTTEQGFYIQDKNNNDNYVAGSSGWLAYSYYTYRATSPIPTGTLKRMTGMAVISKGNSITVRNNHYNLTE